MYKNMKIEITDKVHLDSVCAVLKDIGYKKWRWGNFIPSQINTVSLRTIDNGNFTDFRGSQKYDYGYEKVTLADLLKMRDEMVAK